MWLVLEFLIANNYRPAMYFHSGKLGASRNLIQRYLSAGNVNCTCLSLAEGRAVGIHTTVHRNMTGHTMAAPPPLLFPNPILSPPSSSVHDIIIVIFHFLGEVSAKL